LKDNRSQCPRCATPNNPEEQFCTCCGNRLVQFSQQKLSPDNQQIFSCPNCNYQVSYGEASCPDCKTPFNWLPQQSGTQHYEQEQDYERGTDEKPKRKENPWALGAVAVFFGFIFVGIMLIILNPNCGTTLSTPPGNTKMNNSSVSAGTPPLVNTPPASTQTPTPIPTPTPVPMQFTWAKTFGGANATEGLAGQQTSDGGYIVLGHKVLESGNLIIKTDSNGDTRWDKTYSMGEMHFIQQTSDSGYIVCGTIDKFSQKYVLLLKIDAESNQKWEKTISVGEDPTYGSFVQQATDGGYIITGVVYADGYKLGILIKTDASGNTKWFKTYKASTSMESWGNCVRQTADGGYILAGKAMPGGNAGWLVKTDANGNEQWNSYYGKGKYDGFSSVCQTTDDGYIGVGTTYSTGYIALVKTDANGTIQWEQQLGTAGRSVQGRFVQNTSDGSYVVTGMVPGSNLYLAKVSSSGNLLWEQKDFGSQGSSSIGNFVQQTSDGGYIVVGTKTEAGSIISTIWLVKVGSK
jgi:hypothetical protein